MTNPHDRMPYSAIVDRPRLKLPGGARMVVWTVVNVEQWEIGRPMARQVLPAPTGVSLTPDYPNWSWHEYGMRVGIWRIFDALDKYSIVPTLSINANVCNVYPRVAQAALDAGWEFLGHSFVQMPIHALDDQQGTILRSLDTLEKFTGKRPLGWMGPGLTQTHETVDYLAQAGVKYIADWVHDDQPTEMTTAHGPLITIPYTVEHNDIPMMMVQHHDSGHFMKRAIESFDRLYQESADITRVMALAVHPYITGQPFRIGYFEKLFEYMRRRDGVLFWTGEQIYHWYLQARGEAG
jgi:peptidoglycan/xylan/chitin deacetylase (PgdA/CDA1 family)